MVFFVAPVDSNPSKHLLSAGAKVLNKMLKTLYCKLCVNCVYCWPCGRKDAFFPKASILECPLNCPLLAWNNKGQQTFRLKYAESHSNRLPYCVQMVVVEHTQSVCYSQQANHMPLYYVERTSFLNLGDLFLCHMQTHADTHKVSHTHNNYMYVYIYIY